jgi:hypothetical protein
MWKPLEVIFKVTDFVSAWYNKLYEKMFHVYVPNHGDTPKTTYFKHAKRVQIDKDERRADLDLLRIMFQGFERENLL